MNKRREENKKEVASVSLSPLLPTSICFSFFLLFYGLAEEVEKRRETGDLPSPPILFLFFSLCFRVRDLKREQLFTYPRLHTHADGTQVEQAFAKRSRNMKAASKKKKNNMAPNGSNGVGGVGVARAHVGIGEQARMLMERRKRWVETIGPVFDRDLLTALPPSGSAGSIFNGLDELIQRETAGAAAVGGGGIGVGGGGGGGVLGEEE